jgi:hypothetical protein
LTIFFKEKNENIVKEFSLCINFFCFWQHKHAGKKTRCRVLFVLQNYEFERRRGWEDRKMKTLFQSSSLQARL